MTRLFNTFRSISASRFAFLIFAYGSVLATSLYLAFQLRFDFDVPLSFSREIPEMLLWIVTLKLVMLFFFGQYAGLLTYFSLPDLQRVFFAMVCASLLIGLVRYGFGTPTAPPRGVILADFLLSFIGLSGLRLGFRVYRQKYQQSNSQSSKAARRVAIIGAGDVGANLAHELLLRRGLGLRPVAFFDDDRNKWNSRVHGIPVLGAPEMLLEGKDDMRIEEAVIAMPSASASRLREVVQILQSTHTEFETVPSLHQLATGKVRVTQLRAVDIQDLLGRDPVSLNMVEIGRILAGRVVMVTGAGGSIGSELCRQIAQYGPRELLLVEQSEVQMFVVEQELLGLGYEEITKPFIADVFDQARMATIFELHRPEIVFHAAAHKHVPLMESQPSEAIQNNVLGTVRLAELAVRFRCERFVLISTDKAINPTNVMGATKRLAEMFVQALQKEDHVGTKFMSVRFGNVLGSSGSVIPTFRRQIADGGPVKVTHPEVTRYFMTIPEAVGLVLQSASFGDGGEIFVLDMGEPIKILDLARQMIELSGFRPERDIAIEFTGLRPGEKLFEELAYNSETMDRTQHPKVMRLRCPGIPLSQVRAKIVEMEPLLHRTDPMSLKKMLCRVVPEYTPLLNGNGVHPKPEAAPDARNRKTVETR